jgi:hypothetical protein
MWEYLSLYAKCEDSQERFVVKNYPEPKVHIPEDEILARLGAEGWELVTVVPAYGGGVKINHQLYFKRARDAASWGQATTRLAR